LYEGAHRRARYRRGATLSDVIELRAGDLRVVVSPADGGRVSSLQHHGRELLLTRPDSPMTWGCFPMIPWAGRIRHGRFTFGGKPYTVPVNLGAHAIHGVTFDRPWEQDGADTVAIEFDDRWPFGGHAVQRFELAPGAFMCTIEVHAARQSMPAQAGWHPWFVRPVEVEFDAGSMYERDAEGIPSGAIVTPSAQPWDDCFTDLADPPRLSWPDGSSLVLSATVDHWIVYTEPVAAVCVEPQSGPPDAFNHDPIVVEPGAPLVLSMRWTFDPPPTG
jgi:aldose 1-epimerase